MALDTASLRKAGLFVEFSDRELETLLPRMELMVCKEGETVFEQGSEAESIYVILSGAIEIHMEGERGPQMIAELESGEHFGELPFFDHQDRVASAVASGRTELAVLPYDALKRAAAAMPETGMKLYYAFARTLCERMRTTNDDLASYRDSFPFFAT